MNNLTEIYLEFREALTPLGIEVGRDVRDLWHDREHHGREALPAEALKRLHELVERLVSKPT